jgi:hypothetical protein
MTFSHLISGTVPHHNKLSSRAGSPIVRVIPHHHAATSNAGLDRLTNPNEQASANYIIMSSGRIYGQVPEEYRAWTSGSHEADAPSITFEIQNSGVAVNGNDNDPNSWPISSAAFHSTVALIADIAKRYQWGGVGTYNVRGHREFYSTACPGGYVWNQLGNIRASANALALGKVTNVTPVSKPAPAAPSIKGKTVWTLAQEVIKGVYGSGDARKKALGSQYAAVQAEVNRILAAPAAKLPSKGKKSTAQLVDEVLAGVHGSGDARKKSLGGRYDEVQAAVNRRVGGVNISALADAVIRGEYGTGAERQRRLGVNYVAVQAEVNRRYR